LPREKVPLEHHIDCVHQVDNACKWGYVDSWAKVRVAKQTESEAENDWGGHLGVQVQWGVRCRQVGTQCSPMSHAATNEGASPPSHT
jgi:hypothetical protein